MRSCFDFSHDVIWKSTLRYITRYRTAADDSFRTNLLFFHYSIPQVLDALEHLHHMDVVYLDLKHDSLLMESRRKDVVRLVDFGSCRVIKPDKGQKLKDIESIPEFSGNLIFVVCGIRIPELFIFIELFLPLIIDLSLNKNVSFH